MSLDELVGQRHITKLLGTAHAKGQLSHAYLFTGPKGVGKTSVARILAHVVNDLPYDGTAYIDIIEIDAASNRRIDDIRDLRDKVHIAPTSAKYKVYIIDEVHMLTGESFNALLKTLEEPPAHVIFILATTELHKVPATIVSRTQRFTFRPIPIDDIVGHLRMIADKEKIAITDDALRLVASHGGGSFRDSINLLDQISSGAETEITAGDVEAILGLAPQDEIAQLIELVAQHDQAASTALVQKLCASGTSPQTITEQLIEQLPLSAEKAPHLYGLLEGLLDVSRSYRPQYKLLALVAQAAAPIAARKIVAESIAAPVAIDTPVSALARPKRPPVRPVMSATSSTAVPSVPEAPVAESGLTTPLTNFDWPKVVEMVQQREPALYSVVKRGEVSYEDGVLKLNFAFSLHRKKLENPKYRGQLMGIVREVCGGSPELVVTDGVSLPTEGPAADVAALMGGGEPVRV